MRRSLAIVLAAALGVSLVACGSKKAAAPEPTESASPSPTAEPVYSPLTGEEVTTERTHPVFVVKMDNTYASRPQVGLDKADLVVEELVEGGLTRLALFFDSELPATVGPVRSLRTTDISLVKPVDATVVASGAAWSTLRKLKSAGVDLWLDPGAGTSGSKHFYRVTDRRSPYNLLFSLKKFAKETDPPARDVKPFFSFGDSDVWANAKTKKAIDAGFSAGRHTLWRYTNKGYVNTNTNAAAPGLRPDTVIVIRVKEGDAGYTDPAGNPVPVTILKGGGPMVMFHEGKVVRGTWAKSDRDQPFSFTAAGADLPVPVGRTWVELVPVKGNGGSLR